MEDGSIINYIIAGISSVIVALGGKEVWIAMNNRFKIKKDSEYQTKKIDVDLITKQIALENAERQLQINAAAQQRIVELETQLIQIKTGLSMIITLLEGEFKDKPNISKGLQNIMELFEVGTRQREDDSRN